MLEDILNLAKETLKRQDLDPSIAHVIKHLISIIVTNKFQEENFDGRITCTNCETAEKIVFLFTKSKIPFSVWFHGDTTGNAYDYYIIQVHLKDPNSWTPVFNLATNLDITGSTERELFRAILEKYKVDLVLCPKENNNKWDTV